MPSPSCRNNDNMPTPACESICSRHGRYSPILSGPAHPRPRSLEIAFMPLTDPDKGSVLDAGSLKFRAWPLRVVYGVGLRIHRLPQG